jgi:hypothetical protein
MIYKSYVIDVGEREPARWIARISRFDGKIIEAPGGWRNAFYDTIATTAGHRSNEICQGRDRWWTNQIAILAFSKEWARQSPMRVRSSDGKPVVISRAGLGSRSSRLCKEPDIRFAVASLAAVNPAPPVMVENHVSDARPVEGLWPDFRQVVDVLGHEPVVPRHCRLPAAIVSVHGAVVL